MEDKFFVYAIISEKDGRIYVGFSKDLEKRLAEHDSGKTKSTKGFLPWKINLQRRSFGEAKRQRQRKIL